MKLLFIGGNGNISWYCVQKALEAGHEVWELNRSQTLNTRRDIQSGVVKVTADINNISSNMKTDLREANFDVVIDFICFNKSEANNRHNIFKGHVKNYIFISSESVYKRDKYCLPFSEKSLKYNVADVSYYISGKIEAENFFYDKYSKEGFPITIIRPVLTYDVNVPVCIGHNCFTAPQKYLDGFPALIGGDGNNLMSITHSRDFANALIRLIKNPNIIGEDFHIATNEWLTWNEAMEILFHALKIKEYKSIHIPYEEAININDFLPMDLMKQRLYHNIYDISKISEWTDGWKPLTSYEQGINETVKWLYEKNIRKRINVKRSIVLDNLYNKYMR